MLVDTHCHLDAHEFDADREAMIARAQAAGVGCMVLPAVDRAGFARVRALCEGRRSLRFALGIHPLFVPAARESDLDVLAMELEQAGSETVAVGEIGLDFS